MFILNTCIMYFQIQETNGGETERKRKTRKEETSEVKAERRTNEKSSRKVSYFGF